VADDLTPPVPAGGILLFSYGTLQQPGVQLATFGQRQAWVYALAEEGDGDQARR
jgi:hypothetical protein